STTSRTAANSTPSPRNGSVCRCLSCPPSERKPIKQAAAAARKAPGTDALHIGGHPFSRSMETLHPMIKITNLNKWFGEFHVLKNINLDVGRGDRIVICGPSGSGKSTMIRCINHLESWQQGEIVVD